MRGIEVSAAEIPGELLKVWTSAAEQDRGDSADTRVRAVLSNLVLVVENAELAATQDRIDAIINELCVSHPSRFFIVSTDGAQGIRSSVSSRCVLARNGKHVCSEEIYLQVAADSEPALPNLLLSLLVSDIPTSLIFLGNPASFSKDSSLFQGLGSVVDLVISDSAQFESLQSGLRPVLNSFSGSAELVDGYCFPRRLRDISWRRSRRWRSMITEQFDMPRLSEAIDQFSYIKFEYVSENDNRVPADVLLVAGWMLYSLNWQPQHKESASNDLRINTLGPGGDTPSLVFVNRLGSKLPAQAGSLVSVSFELEVSGETYRLLIGRDFEKALAQIEFCSEGVCDFPRTSPFGLEPFENCLLDEIYSSGEEFLYAHAAENALKLEMLLD